jgi:hypothetical protein
MSYFSDREYGNKPLTIEHIVITVWNGIVAIFEDFLSNNSFSKNFPEQCPDKKGISGCNTILLYDKLKAHVPNIEIPISRKEEYSIDYEDFSEPKKIYNYVDITAVLDFIEFCYHNLCDAISKGDYHEFFGHYHLTFKDTGESNKRFISEINSLFERNGIAFQLSHNGNINRVHPPEISNLASTYYKTKDSKINELISEATSAFIMPRRSDKLRATEKLWDAFERIKSCCHSDKKTSIKLLLKLASNGNIELEKYLEEESRQLTEIGSNFQIRHFEMNKHEINDDIHLDYLFIRLLCLIHLFTKKIT